MGSKDKKNAQRANSRRANSQRADSVPPAPEDKEATPPTASDAGRMNDTGANKEKDGSDTKSKEDEDKRFLLGRKLDYASTLANVCMLWWVSSLVFSGSIFAAVWFEREKLVASRIIHPLGVFLSLFFLGVAFFGYRITRHYLCDLARDLSDYPAKVNDKNIEEFLDTELSIFRWSMGAGTVSFAFILLMWIVFWYGLACRGWSKA